MISPAGSPTAAISRTIKTHEIGCSITTSYAALVEAQRSNQIVVSYHGPLSVLFAEQQFGAIPIMVDSTDGVNPASYNSYLLAGKDSPVTTVQEIRGQDFAFVDPASASGNLFPRVMLIEEGIDPNHDIRGRYAGNHQNSILAIAKGQVPCGASNNLSVSSALSRGVLAEGELVILKVSPNIPNGPFAVHPELDPRAVAKIQEVFGQFQDPRRSRRWSWQVRSCRSTRRHTTSSVNRPGSSTCSSTSAACPSRSAGEVGSR
jgi:phosphonate transport system substrate-binding protein